MPSEDRSVNWEKWRLIPAVKLWQAVALSLNIDPDRVRSDYSWKAETTRFPESQTFRDRLDVLRSNLGEPRISSQSPSTLLTLSALRSPHHGLQSGLHL